MKGFYGRILVIDATRRESHSEPVPEEILRTCLGGKGLATWLLTEHNPPGVNPLSPENRLIIAAGPAAGTSVWGGARYGVYTKSPLTGVYAESYSGGKAPEAVDAAGYDAVLIHGKAPATTVVAISPDGAVFHDAAELAGMDCYAAEDAVLEKFTAPDHARTGALVIGPAGEAEIPFSIISNDYWRCAGRAGVGAVMGSKNIKGLIFQGSEKRDLHDPDAIRAQSRELAKISKTNPGVAAYKSKGTSMMVDMLNAANSFPTGYWESGSCDHREGINAEALHTRCDVTPHACLKCFMACGRMATVKQGRHAGMRMEGPEYETIYAFGGLCGIKDIEDVIWMNDICDRLGMDTITAGNLCAFAMEAGKRGRLDGAPAYGDPDATAALLEQIARKEGIGAILANGIRPAAAQLGLEDIAVHVKGMEPAGYDPRSLKGMGLAYAVSDRGACHLRATFYKPELAGMIDPDTVEGKAELFVDFEDRLTLFDTLILCRFYRDLYDWEGLGRLVEGTTGVPGDKENLQRIAATVSDMVRRFNLREGVTKEDDRLPPKFFGSAIGDGLVITEAEMDRMVSEYYSLRGWDGEGRPPAAAERNAV